MPPTPKPPVSYMLPMLRRHVLGGQVFSQVLSVSLSFALMGSDIQEMYMSGFTQIFIIISNEGGLCKALGQNNRSDFGGNLDPESAVCLCFL